MHKEFTLGQIRSFMKGEKHNQSIPARMMRALMQHLEDPAQPMIEAPVDGKIHFMGTARIQLQPFKDPTTGSTVEYVDFFLDHSNNLDGKRYLDEEGIVNSLEGHKALTQCFLHGISGNIGHAQATGRWNETEHLKYVIAYLEKAVFHPADQLKGYRNPNDGPGESPSSAAKQ